MKPIYSFFLGLFCLNAFGQNSLIKNNLYSLKASAFTSTQKDLPFWLRANQYGTVPNQSNFVQLSALAQHEYDSLYNRQGQLNRFSFGYGLDVSGNIGSQNHFFLTQAYAKIRFKALELYVGRRKEIFGLVDSSSTSGSYIWSGNALPMPKVQIHTPNYVYFGKHKRLAFNAGISHGWFGKDSVVQGAWLHQKWLYLRFGKPNAAFKFYAGANHQAQWGGHSDILEDLPEYATTINGKLAPYPLYSYQYLLLPFLQKIIPPDKNKVPSYDGGLAVGNQLGSVDIAAEINPYWGHILIYKQLPYDFARSIAHLNNIEDGLHGISVRIHEAEYVQKIIFEFFNSKSQGRYRFGKLQPSNYGEVDNYFYHGQYQSWSYKNHIIGTPFIIFKKDGRLRYNNRIQYFYLGLEGTLLGLQYHTKHAFSNNFGSYGAEFLKRQYSGFLSLKKPLYNKQLINLQLAFDSGQLYNNSFGLSLTYQKSL
ncbi:capsule assembly Wzi family protein [Marinilongibacter aquaticus]|uniref:capsule assembly Wzi family protein n=1 Tax=Marinilongibacter aquaticus TaxID=2975157 RepID=UPI0021BDD598|nr:capsule assembly Wzi family protein [Marinilongibacter aquaticus]UBM57653.1 capsule assembly Wzi family protein [Marinilongibacter aquaticus]